MSNLAYLGVLALILLGSCWLELVVRTHVFRRWRRLLGTLGPVVAAFYLWDAYAVHERHWSFDANLVTGLTLPGGVPLEEALFFVVVPLAAVLTLEAVRAVRGLDVGEAGP